jgi:UDP-2-acetamido-2,6-beta-L-arabino-hexul-4-ose reductase
MKVAVTGAKGLLGWHTAGRLYAENCAARYAGQPDVHDIILLDRSHFADPALLPAKLEGVDAILHFAGVNRGETTEVENGNPDIAIKLVSACEQAGAVPHIVYANSTHAGLDTVYGNSKRIAGEILHSYAGPSYTDIVFPHIFGECARPYYNNVTATLIDNLWSNVEPKLDPEGQVKLLHAGKAAELAICSVLNSSFGKLEPDGRIIRVAELFDQLQHFHALYSRQIFPDLSDPFDLALFNCLRTGAFPKHSQRPIKANIDHRGTLFESAKGGNAPHTFLSTTHPEKNRGDHFHVDLVEKF